MISLSTILEYLYNKFIITFILCLIGAIIREMMSTVKMTSINIKRMMASIVMASTLMCVVVDYMDFSFSIYIVVCIVAGIWSPTIMGLVLNSKVMGKIVYALLGHVKEPLAKGVSEALSEIEEESKSKEKDESKDTSDETDEEKKDDS